MASNGTATEGTTPLKVLSPPGGDLDLAPLLRPPAWPVERRQRFEHHALDAVGLAGQWEIRRIVALEARHHADRPGQLELLEEHAALVVGLLGEQLAAEPQHVEGTEAQRGRVAPSAREVGAEAVEVVGAAGVGHELAVEHQSYP
jgi:hypothetical protein